MPEENKFSFENLYSGRAPEARPRVSAVKRGKYDFAVAYPDPKSIPFDGLVEGLQDALRVEGEDLAIYAHPQGYGPSANSSPTSSPETGTSTFHPTTSSWGMDPGSLFIC